MEKMKKYRGKKIKIGIYQREIRKKNVGEKYNNTKKGGGNKMIFWQNIYPWSEMSWMWGGRLVKFNIYIIKLKRLVGGEVDIIIWLWVEGGGAVAVDTLTYLIITYKFQLNEYIDKLFYK